jgi:16S rRNA (cytosine967-C5)-methyltransferase
MNTAPVKPVPLSRLLSVAAACVADVAKGRSLSERMPQVEPVLRPGVQALTFHVMRHWGTARALEKLLVPKSPAPPIKALLHTALALMQTAEGAQQPPYPPHTLVSQAVEAAKSHPSTRFAAGLINACLRRYLAEPQALLEQALVSDEARWNHPQWWIDQLRQDHPQHWQDILRQSNRAAPMVLRVNGRQKDVAQYLRLLEQSGLNAQPWGQDGVLLEQAVGVDRLPGFSQGWCSVQDGSAQLAADVLLADRSWSKEDRILDACAAPGGKTAHLLERSDADVLALDVDALRARRVGESLARLGLRATVQVADAADTHKWWDGRLFSAILLDAPCSASGIVRRHPDVRWLRRESDIAQLAQQQQRLFDALWPLLAPGGVMVYATCSVFLQEGEEQAQAFLQRHTQARRTPATGHLLPGFGAMAGDMNDNPPGGYDGFYYARFEKASA